MRLPGSSSSRPPTASGLVAPAPDRVSSAAPSFAALTAFEAEIVAVFADLVVLLGLPKSMGEIYGFIFASAEPPTFADIEQKLGLSKGSVSQGLRALRELGAVREAEGGLKTEDGRRTTEDGGLRTEDAGRKSEPRATHWVATTELRQLIGTLLRERLTPYIQRQDMRMEKAEAALEGDATKISAKDYKALKQRLSKLQTWQSRAGTILPVLGKMI